MTTFENRPNAALLVIDMQNNAVERAHDRDAVVANVADLVERARREGCPWSGSGTPMTSLHGEATGGTSSPS
jgi:isochorismate hydrolase